MTTFKRVANNAASTLASSLSADGTLLTVQDGSSFPESNFWATVENADGLSREIVLVKARSGNQLVGLTRGEQGTTPCYHAAGSRCRVLWTAGHVEAITAAINDLEHDVLAQGQTLAAHEASLTALEEAAVYGGPVFCLGALAAGIHPFRLTLDGGGRLEAFRCHLGRPPAGDLAVSLLCNGTPIATVDLGPGESTGEVPLALAVAPGDYFELRLQGDTEEAAYLSAKAVVRFDLGGP